MKLEGKVAIVAGGGQGIGEGIVRCLAEEGADVAVVDIKSDTAKKVADAVKSMGRKSLPIIADLTDDDKVEKSVQETVDFFGKVDILVNDVGGVSEETGQLMTEYAASLGDVASLPSYMRYSSEVWDRFYQLNLKSHVMMSHAVTPHFVGQKNGSIVNISSVAGRKPDPNQMPYAAFKAGDDPPEFDPEGAVVADLVVGRKLEKVAVRINREQGLVENFKNGNVAFLEDVPQTLIKKAEKTALAAAGVLGLNFAGVDIMLDPDKQDAIVIELNAFPGFPKVRRFNLGKHLIKEIGEKKWK